MSERIAKIIRLFSKHDAQNPKDRALSLFQLQLKVL